MPAERERPHARVERRPALVITATVGVVFLAPLVVLRLMEPLWFGGGSRSHATSWAPVIGCIIALVVSIAVTYLLSGESRRAAVRQVTYRDRITEVKDHLARTSTLLCALEDDLATRTALLEQVQTKAERYEKLASLNADQAKAVEDLVGRQFQRQGRSNAIYWWAGIVIAFALGLIVNWISAPLWAWITG
jgi:hypothetical protein